MTWRAWTEAQDLQWSEAHEQERRFLATYGERKKKSTRRFKGSVFPRPHTTQCRLHQLCWEVCPWGPNVGLPSIIWDYLELVSQAVDTEKPPERLVLRAGMSELHCLSQKPREIHAWRAMWSPETGWSHSWGDRWRSMSVLALPLWEGGVVGSEFLTYS